jgi:prepilin-type N-terminal cleavage/methylation domain-containing protein
MAITSKKNKTNPNWFTIMEILISVSVLAIGFAGIFVMMQNSTQITQHTQTKTLAINLTREAVEIIHNIRDTNRTRRAGNPESCRLKTDPLVDENNDGCQNDPRMQSGWYVIQEKTAWDQKYFSLDLVPILWLTTQEDAINSRSFTQLCQAQTGRSSCYDTGTNVIITRAIHVLWLYDKDTTTTGWNLLNCSDGVMCWSNTPKELRFCAHTHIIADKSSHIQLCSILTNFKQ